VIHSRFWVEGHWSLRHPVVVILNTVVCFLTIFNVFIVIMTDVTILVPCDKMSYHDKIYQSLSKTGPLENLFFISRQQRAG
jgi:hypothetical protein